MTISPSNIEIQSVHSISTTISRELIKDAILAAYEKSNRPYDFDISVNIELLGEKRALRSIRNSKKRIPLQMFLLLWAIQKRKINWGLRLHRLGILLFAIL